MRNAPLGIAVALYLVWIGAAVLSAFPTPTLEYDPTQYVTQAERAEARQDYDTKAQVWMAWAAWAQVTVGVFGLGGLGITIYFARNAWLESKEAAVQAKRSADLAEQELVDLRRPYVVAYITSFDLWDGVLASVDVRLSNIGEQPADILDCHVDLIAFEERPNKRRPDEDAFGSDNVLDVLPGGQMLGSRDELGPLSYVRAQRLGPENRTDFLDGRAAFYCWGRFSYTGPTGMRRDAGFCFQFMPPTKNRVGGPSLTRVTFGNFDRPAKKKDGEPK